MCRAELSTWFSGFTCMFVLFDEIIYVLFFFFFQAEDGIRDVAVTGVQTCALPISWRRRRGSFAHGSKCPRQRPSGRICAAGSHRRRCAACSCSSRRISGGPFTRSESTRLNSSHGYISYAVFCLKKKKKTKRKTSGR